MSRGRGDGRESGRNDTAKGCCANGCVSARRLSVAGWDRVQFVETQDLCKDLFALAPDECAQTGWVPVAPHRFSRASSILESFSLVVAGAI